MIPADPDSRAALLEGAAFVWGLVFLKRAAITKFNRFYSLKDEVQPGGEGVPFRLLSSNPGFYIRIIIMLIIILLLIWDLHEIIDVCLCHPPHVHFADAQILLDIVA